MHFIVPLSPFIKLVSIKKKYAQKLNCNGFLFFVFDPNLLFVKLVEIYGAL